MEVGSVAWRGRLTPGCNGAESRVHCTRGSTSRTFQDLAALAEPVQLIDQLIRGNSLNSRWRTEAAMPSVPPKKYLATPEICQGLWRAPGPHFTSPWDHGSLTTQIQAPLWCFTHSPNVFMPLCGVFQSSLFSCYFFNQRNFSPF